MSDSLSQEPTPPTVLSDGTPLGAVVISRTGDRISASIVNCTQTAEIWVVTGENVTPQYQIYPRMFPFFEDGIVIFCNEDCFQVQLAFALHEFFNSCDRISRSRRYAIMDHILKSIFPEQWKDSQNELIGTSVTASDDDDDDGNDNVVSMDIDT